MGSGPNWYQNGNKACHILKVSKFYIKRRSMLTDLKFFSLTSRCLFYRPEHNAKGDPMELNFEGLEIQK